MSIVLRCTVCMRNVDIIKDEIVPSRTTIDIVGDKFMCNRCINKAVNGGITMEERNESKED